ncbi:F420-dependent NADP oxidoreductase [Acinetobacter sp. LoGeW2-3]|uniref:Rossmann-like and DUF2520 domain-containing protein n=1 Tax=Acinetobacter sp. LoGeW2-3 TaxID=1808001 RepID=UPI000C059211|nr:F420-dependent NADP oxidoreductase [Acinetobacter sp. LoGeW2-3]ATO20874.1 F420-dependent NADP oxidoreductase [Acinetobacter sp. LoGeW2-3]
MRITIIGAGRVAYHLARVLSEQHEVVQIYSRTLEKAQQLAEQFKAQAIAQPKELLSDVDLVIIAVSDQSIASVIEQIHPYLPHNLIVHTSGSTHLDVLKKVHARAGVFYPLQTFSLERDIDWQTTPLFIEAANEQDQTLLLELAKSLSKRVYNYSSSQRLSLHLAAVFACNFSNYCYDMAKQVVDAENVDFSLLYPLILETANKATQNDPRQMQTGPAMRGDQNILNMHQQMLEQSQRNDLAEVYALLSQQILQRHQSS